MTTKHITKNLTISLLAQVISLATSFVFGIIVPKYIDEYQYAYWQTYLLYAGYVGVLQFGLLDGIVLRYSQYDFSQLDKERFRSQFQLLLLYTSLLTFVGTLIGIVWLQGIQSTTLILVSVAIITKHIVAYNSYIFQITNRIQYYAIFVIAQKVVYALLVILLLAFKVHAFYWYCIADLVGDLIAFALGTFVNRGMYFGKMPSWSIIINETKSNISCGILLMIANFSSGLIVGGAKMIVQWRWDMLLFGKIAFAFSVSNLFLAFVTAISVVLFPSLKRMQEEELPELYGKIRSIISPLLMAAMLMYFPVSKVLSTWLPKYSPSLVYLGILLPIIVFSSKVSLLTNNYLKAYRREKLMLIINLASVVLGVALFLVCAYALNNLDYLLYCVVLVIMIRSIVSEIAVGKVIHKSFWKDFIVEALMTAGFIVSVRVFSLLIGCVVYSGFLIVYMVINRKEIATMFQTVGQILHRKGNSL